jgi:glycosyltransferase involved in cell wall biosynthesis
MNPAKLPEISIVIPTYNRPDCLIRLLDSLLFQTVSKEIFEIIVVDNAPEEIPNQVKILCERPAYSKLDLQYIFHPDIGVSSARNRGVSAARAELIGFLDDDSLPHPDWVETLLRVFSETKADILGGPTKPYYMVTKPPWIRDTYFVTTQGEKACWLNGIRAVSGSNMAWRKRVISDLGGFSLSYGYIGNKKVYGDETELNQRARKAGYSTWYDPRLMVEHCAHPNRMRVGWFFSSGYRYGQVKARLNYQFDVTKDFRPASRKFLSQLKSLTVNLICMIGSLLGVPFRSRTNYPYWQNYAVEFVQPRIQRFSQALKLIEIYILGEENS